MSGTPRPRGGIRERGNSFQVRVSAGKDPVTGKVRYLAASVPGTDRAARRRAEKALTRLQSQVDSQRVPESGISLGQAIDEWLAANEIEDTTRRTYVGYIERTIKPCPHAVTAMRDCAAHRRWPGFADSAGEQCPPRPEQKRPALARHRAHRRSPVPLNPYPQPPADEVDLVEVLRPLADPVRLRIAARLTDGEHHPCGTVRRRRRLLLGRCKRRRGRRWLPQRRTAPGRTTPHQPAHRWRGRCRSRRRRPCTDNTSGWRWP